MTRRGERDGTLRSPVIAVQATHAFVPSLLALVSAPQEGAEQWILIVVWALALLGVGAAAVAVLVRLRRDVARATDAADHLARIESAVAQLLSEGATTTLLPPQVASATPSVSITVGQPLDLTGPTLGGGHAR